MQGKVKMVVKDLNVSEEFLTLVERLSNRGIIVELLIEENNSHQSKPEMVKDTNTISEINSHQKTEKKKNLKTEVSPDTQPEEEFFGML
jgi:hypothetical protein